LPDTKLLLFPEPQECEIKPGQVVLATGQVTRCSIVLAGDASAMERTAAQIVQKAVAEKAGGVPVICTSQPVSDTVPIWVGEIAREVLRDEAFDFTAKAQTAGLDSPSGEAYALEATPTGVALRGVGGPGTFYAAQTLAQLISCQNNEVTVPVASVRDWPQMNQRGLFVESKWGQDLMTLADWKAAIDQLASLKMNLLGVGVYGCWRIQYDLKPTEFMLLPLEKYPDLHTRKTLDFYSARKNAWQSLTYLPTMYAEDFFGEVVAYGRSRNVKVRPHFNSLGHNTLIPRLYPEVSAKDAHGQPRGYGLCLTSPQTRKMMEEILCEIVDRYLAPYGVDDFHLGLDEVWPLTGLYAYHPQQRVEPWCECPSCRKADQNELFVDYILGLVSALKARGIRHVTLWHDQLERMGVLDDSFVELLEERGLKDTIILNWWRYAVTPFETTKPELGLRRRVSPLGGYWLWSPYRNYLVNIESMSRLGVEERAEGIEAYSLYDEAFDNHQRLIADCGWNYESVGSLPEWKEKYAHYVFGPQWEKGLQAMRDFDEVSELGSTLLGFVQKLDAYGYTYVHPQRAYPRAYPQEALAALLADEEGAERLKAATGAAGRARQAFAELAETRIPRGDIAAQMEAEAWRVEGLVRVFDSLVKAKEAYEKASQAGGHDAVREAVATARDHIVEALRLHHRVTLACERAKAEYLLPTILRNWSTMLPFLDQTLAALEACLAGAPLPEINWTNVE
jgi:hypothetical protein